MYWRWHRINEHGARMHGAVSRSAMYVGRSDDATTHRPELYRWRRHWPDEKSNECTTGFEQDKNGHSNAVQQNVAGQQVTSTRSLVLCCNSRLTQQQLLLAVRRRRCSWTVEMNVLPSSVVPMPNSRLLSLLSDGNTRPVTSTNQEFYTSKKEPELVWA